MQGVYQEEEPPYEGNSVRTRVDNPFLPLDSYPMSHVQNRQNYLRNGSAVYTGYDDLRARTDCFNYIQRVPGCTPSVRCRRISFQGNIHWADDGLHYQQWPAFVAGSLMPPQVFLSLVYDTGVTTKFLPVADPSTQLPLPRLDLLNCYNMHMPDFDQLPYNPAGMPCVFPGPNPYPSQEKRYKTLWSKCFILPEDPEHTYETLREEQDPPYPVPPIEFKREYRWLERNRYFRGSVEVDLPVLYDFNPLVLDPPGSQTPWLAPSQGALYWVAWQIGGIAHGGSPQQVYMNLQIHWVHTNNEIH